MSEIDTKEEPVLIGRYHNTMDGEWHKGHSSECSICRDRKRNEDTKRKAKKNGRLGGNVRSGKEKSPRPTCASCEKPVDYKNKSGFCATCLIRKRAEARAERRTTHKGTCKSCDKPLCYNNTTGFCAKCYRKSDLWKQHAEEHGSYMNVILTHGSSS